MDINHHRVKKLYRGYLKGKRVVLVGPSPSIIGSGQGEKIDSYDVVVRLNQALPIVKNLEVDIGSRTDVLYSNLIPENCGSRLAPFLNKTHLKFVIGAYPPIENMEGTSLTLKADTYQFYKTYRHQFRNFCYFDKNYFQKLWKIMRLPNTGTCAILDLLKSDLKELYITGITFFHDGYYPEYKNWTQQELLINIKRAGVHQLEAQWTFMKTILQTDPKIHLDHTLQQLCTHFDNKSTKENTHLISGEINDQSYPKKKSTDDVDSAKITNETNTTRGITSSVDSSNNNQGHDLKNRRPNWLAARNNRRTKLQKLQERRLAKKQFQRDYYLRKKRIRQQQAIRKRQPIDRSQTNSKNQFEFQHKVLSKNKGEDAQFASIVLQNQTLPKSVNLFSRDNQS